MNNGFVFKLDTEAAATNNVGNGKLESGVHDVEIKGIYLSKTKQGNNTVDIVIETDKGQKAVIFGMCIDETWKTGSKNVKYATWMELALVAGIREGVLKEQSRKMNGKDEMHYAFVEATGKKVKMAIQEEFDAYNNEQKDAYHLIQTFGPEGHTVQEKQEGKPAERIKTFEVKPWYTPAWKAAKEAGTLKIPTFGSSKTEQVSQDSQNEETATETTVTADTPLF